MQCRVPAQSCRRALELHDRWPRRYVRCHAAAVGSCKELKTQLRGKLRGMSDQLYMVPEAQQEEVQDLIRGLEEGNPTHDPRNCQDKLAGCWALLYTSRSLSEATHNALGALKPLRLYHTIDISQMGIINSIEFTEDGKHALPGSLNISADFEWETSGHMNVNVRGVDIASDDLQQRLSGDSSVLMSAFAPDGPVDITFEDDGVFIARDQNGVYVFEHRITRVHA